MAVISIIGAPGAGKSFLVKQLASLDGCPAFFEGEGGTVPASVLKSVLSDPDPVVRFEFFLERYSKNLERARKISDIGINCYVDGAVQSFTAMILYEAEEHRAALQKVADKVANLTSDKVILLTANEAKLKEMMVARGRSLEKNKESIQRALDIQKKFLEVAEQDTGIVIVDRTEMDFLKEDDLKKVKSIILK